MLVNLDSQESEELVHLLRERLAELSEEISHTDVADFRGRLGDQKVTLERILNKITDAVRAEEDRMRVQTGPGPSQ